ncbi:phosphatidylglycerophosphatase A [Thermosulfurimonas sp. F29]|uniref:phosphatidylglycerophosphatase A family protein n=1 Tax=Thermosulfurimonas sp. F29 TaxID=2867247 RepID=UPI0021079346|nr:phosphatidylglycerophosphatase A [Thermosulfurimonas sp. F29]
MFFGLGKIPWAPGTWGSAAGIFLYWITSGWPLWGRGLFLVVLTLMGVWASGRTEDILRSKDPSCVIIDEVAGAYLAVLGHAADPLHLAMGFLLFRILDIGKPWPVNQGEKWPGGRGIMADDLLAGGIVNGIITIFIR